MVEITEPHTGLLRLGLAVPQSVVFWSRASSEAPAKELVVRALEESWYPELSQARTDYLVKQLERRFPYPVRQKLGFRSRSDQSANQLICHWHLQLVDPLYRRFTQEFLLSRWSAAEASVNLEQSEAWVRSLETTRDWKSVTVRRLASGLLSAAGEAGLCSGSGRGDRQLRLPQVQPSESDYLTALLEMAGVPSHLPEYLISVGVSLEVEES